MSWIYTVFFMARALHEDDPFCLFAAPDSDDDDDDDDDNDQDGKIGKEQHGNSNLVEKEEAADGKGCGVNGGTISSATVASAVAAYVSKNNGDKGRESGGDLTAALATRASQWDPETGKRVLPEHVKTMLSAIKVTRFDEVMSNRLHGQVCLFGIFGWCKCRGSLIKIL